VLSIFNLSGGTAQSGRSHCSIQAEPLLNFAGRADFAERCTQVFPNCGGLVATLGNELPLCFAEKLSNELGVFLGGDTFEEYVGRLSVKQEMPACSLYQSNRYSSFELS